MNLWENCFPRFIRPAVTFQSRDLLCANGPSLKIPSEQVCPYTQVKAHSNAVSVFSVYELYVSLHFWDNLQDNKSISNAFSRKGLLGMVVIKNVITFSKNDYFFMIPFNRAASFSSPASTFINQSDVTTTWYCVSIFISTGVGMTLVAAVFKSDIKYLT